MEVISYTGPVLAITVFITIGAGHVMVRYLNYHFGTKPGIPFLLAGIALMGYSLFVQSDLWSSVIGIIGMTVLWDGIEFYRQEKRVLKGHAPENPKRPIRNK